MRSLVFNEAIVLDKSGIPPMQISCIYSLDIAISCLSSCRFIPSMFSLFSYNFSLIPYLCCTLHIIIFPSFFFYYSAGILGTCKALVSSTCQWYPPITGHPQYVPLHHRINYKVDYFKLMTQSKAVCVISICVILTGK